MASISYVSVLYLSTFPYIPTLYHERTEFYHSIESTYSRPAYLGCSNNHGYQFRCPSKQVHAVFSEICAITDMYSYQNFTVLTILYAPVIFLAKLSVLLLYLELFSISKQTRIMVAIALAISISQCLATIIGNAILCVPKPGVIWMIGDNTHNCRVVADLYGVIMGAISVFSDFFVIWIPLPVIWQLHLPVRKRVGVSVIFITGILWVLLPLLQS